VFLFSATWAFRQQSHSALERSQYRLRAFWLVAKQVGYLIPRQRAPRPLAFLRASVLRGPTCSRATRIWVALVWEILKSPVQKAAGFSWGAQVFFRGRRSLPPLVFSHP